MTKPRTLYDKIVDAHTVRELDGEGQVLLYVDRTILNEYTSPQAFTGLRVAGRKVWNPSAALMVATVGNSIRLASHVESGDALGS